MLATAPAEPASTTIRSGRGAVVARASGGETAIVSARATSPLRLVRPTFFGAVSAAVCLVTFGGGLVDGDELELDVDVDAGAKLVVFTQASTKVFRGASRQSLRARVDGTLFLLPDPVSAFAGAEYRQRIEVALGSSGSCVLLDGFTSGRAAFGDRWAMRGLDLRTTVTYGGHELLRDALCLDVSDGPIGDRVGRFDAFATVIAVGRDVELTTRELAEPPPPPSSEVVIATSSLPRARALGLPGSIARVAATSPARALAAVRARLGSLSRIGAADPFGARY